MKLNNQGILTINIGSSRLKFVLYQSCAPPKLRLSENVDRIGLSDAAFKNLD